MRVQIDSLPEEVQATVEGKRAEVSYGDPERPSVVRVAVDDGDLILFPDRSYRHEDLARALGLKS